MFALLGAWAYAGLSAIGLGLIGISFAAVPVAALWLALALWLGRRQAVLAQQPRPPDTSAGLPLVSTPQTVPL